MYHHVSGWNQLTVAIKLQFQMHINPWMVMTFESINHATMDFTTDFTMVIPHFNSLAVSRRSLMRSVDEESNGLNLEESRPFQPALTGNVEWIPAKRPGEVGIES